MLGKARDELWVEAVNQAGGDIRLVIGWMKEDASTINNFELDKLLNVASGNYLPVDRATAAKSAFCMLVSHFEEV